MEQQVKQSIASYKRSERKYKIYYIEDEILLIIDLTPEVRDTLLFRSILPSSWKNVSSWENESWILDPERML